MIIIYIAIACIIVYGFLFGYRQMQSLQERITRLESEKQEMESLLLTFMESMNDIVANDVSKAHTAMSQPPSVRKTEQEVIETAEETEDIEMSQADATDRVDVEDVLLRHSVRDAARLLGKGEGEMALYAKFRKK